MIVCDTISGLRRTLTDLRRNFGGEPVGFVPTMGALHAGHLSLIEAARHDCAITVVSIFVNPTQFGPSEDFQQYPRPIEQDLALCRSAGVDVAFLPTTEEMYPKDCMTQVHVTQLSEPLCGRSRPGHFDGVALVVAKLFNIVQPDKAYFGQKDAQQASVIRRMVRDLNFPIEIVVCPIVREPDGLAMSSRNAYLKPAERQQAVVLSRTLCIIREKISKGERDAAEMLQSARAFIEQSGPCKIDYVELVDPQTMQSVSQVNGPVLAVLAVKIGNCRLIDNVQCTPPK